jgi:hypothetical protein
MAQGLRIMAQGLRIPERGYERTGVSKGRETMKKYFLVVATVIFLLIAQAGTASQPMLNGHLEGVELCAQFQCGVAVFVGQFKGQVNNQRAKGGFLVLVNHKSLPAFGEPAADITGGEWNLRAGVNLLQGDVAQGNIVNNGNNTFTIKVVLQIAEGGSGEIVFTGILDHNDFPPTVEGDLTQPPAP